MIGYSSTVVNGQLVPIAPKAGFSPIAFGPAFTGPAMWPRQGVYNVPPVLPSAGLQASMAPGAYGASPGQYPLPTQTGPNGSPWHLTKSPVLWGVGFLAAGLGMLHFIHFK